MYVKEWVSRSGRSCTNLSCSFEREATIKYNIAMACKGELDWKFLQTSKTSLMICSNWTLILVQLRPDGPLDPMVVLNIKIAPKPKHSDHIANSLFLSSMRRFTIDTHVLVWEHLYFTWAEKINLVDKTSKGKGVRTDRL